MLLGFVILVYDCVIYIIMTSGLKLQRTILVVDRFGSRLIGGLLFDKSIKFSRVLRVPCDNVVKE